MEALSRIVQSNELKQGDKFRYIGGDRVITVTKVDEEKFYYNGGLTEEYGSRKYPVSVQLLEQ